MKEEVERLEELLLTQTHGNFERCKRCNKVYRFNEIRQCFFERTCVESYGCVNCTPKDDWQYCTWCPFLPYCTKTDHTTSLLSCDMPDCENKFCKGHIWRRILECGHNICRNHPTQVFQKDGQIVCYLCRLNRRKSLLVLLGLLRRKSVCHKDIYSNVFIPLIQTMNDRMSRNKRIKK